jgi:hypothetical protein
MAFRVILVFIVLFFGWALPLDAQEQQRVSVAGIRANSERARLVAARMAGLLEAEMLKQTGLKVVERKESDLVFQEQRLQQTGITEVATAVELGKNLNVDRMIFGAVEEAAGTLHIILKAVRVENSELAFSGSDEAEVGNRAAVNKAYYGLVERLLTALTGREVSIARPTGPQRLVLLLTEGDLNPAVNLPKKSAVMVMLLADNQAVDSAVVAKRTGWGEWNARLTVPNYESQEISVNFYTKGPGVRQFIGSCSFETPADGVFSFGTTDQSGKTAASRFRLALEIE